jgi:hypothetical protein
LPLPARPALWFVIDVISYWSLVAGSSSSGVGETSLDAGKCPVLIGNQAIFTCFSWSAACGTRVLTQPRAGVSHGVRGMRCVELLAGRQGGAIGIMGLLPAATTEFIELACGNSDHACCLCHLSSNPL